MYPRQNNQNRLLPCTELVLNSSYSAPTGFSPAYTLCGFKPKFPLEASVYSVTHSRVASVSDGVAHIPDIAQSLPKTLAQIADSISKQANHKRHEVNVCVGNQAWLSTEHLQLPSSLSYEFDPRFVGPFQVLEVVTPVSFRLDLPIGQCIHPVIRDLRYFLCWTTTVVCKSWRFLLSAIADVRDDY